MTKKLAFIFTSIVVSSVTMAASFDCSKAKTFVETAICQDGGLSKLDEDLAKTYSSILATAKDKNKIKSFQRLWLSQVRNKCLDKNCLIDAYSKQNYDLKNGFPAAGATTLTVEDLYRKLNIRTFFSSYGQRLQFYCESYLKDFFRPENSKIKGNSIELSDGDDFWRISVTGSNQISVVNAITGGAYKSSKTYSVHYDSASDDWRANEAFIDIPSNCENFKN